MMSTDLSLLQLVLEASPIVQFVMGLVAIEGALLGFAGGIGGVVRVVPGPHGVHLAQQAMLDGLLKGRQPGQAADN